MYRQPLARRRRALPEEQDEPIDVPNAIPSMPVRVTGHGRLEAGGAIDSIAASNCLLVVQCYEPIEILTGIETPNKYVIHDIADNMGVASAK
ncbi:unnamed protein product [Caenorhabditis sp. 36 PRJEB53466]|nr:unnamed protein product [Caenorhabditis sp. 36 PRJEB53466]